MTLILPIQHPTLRQSVTSRGDKYRKLFLTLAALCLLIVSAVPAECAGAKPTTNSYDLTNKESNAESRELRSGWYPDEPYQVKARPGSANELSGLDIQIKRSVAGICFARLPVNNHGTELVYHPESFGHCRLLCFRVVFGPQGAVQSFRSLGAGYIAGHRGWCFAGSFPGRGSGLRIKDSGLFSGGHLCCAGRFREH